MDNMLRLNLQARHNILLKKREELGFNQAEMAEYCSVPVQVYGNAERLVSIGETAALKIASALTTDPKLLFPNWLKLYGKMFNISQNYIELDNIYAQKVLDGTYAGSRALLKEDFDTELEKAMKEVLDERQIDIIKRYFGLNGRKSETLEEIGDELNLTRNRIRQIKEKALRSLRRVSNRNLLNEFFNYKL